MFHKRIASAGGLLIVVATLGLSAGCGEPMKDGDQVKVDPKAEESKRKSMEQFYGGSADKKAAAK